MEKNIEEKQNTPDLSQILTDGRPVFGGKSPNDNGAEPGGKPALPGPDAEKKEEPASGGKPAEEKAGETAGEEPGKKPGAPEGKEGEDKAALTKKDDTHPDPALRFKSHEEAEKGYKEVQAKATKAEQRASDLEKENLAFKAERVREKTENERQESQTAARAKVLEFGKARKKQALEAIDELDPDDPLYRDKASELLTGADIDIYESYRQNQQAPPAEPPAGGKPAGEEAPGTKAKPGEKPDEQVVAREHILDRVKKAGIADDDDLFWLFAGQTPAVDAQGKRLEFDRQIDWALERTKTYQSKQEVKFKESIEKVAGEKGRKNQEEGLPLGRGGSPSGPGATEPGKEKTDNEQKPFGLNDAVDYALSTRKID